MKKIILISLTSALLFGNNFAAAQAKTEKAILAEYIAQYQKMTPAERAKTLNPAKVLEPKRFIAEYIVQYQKMTPAEHAKDEKEEDEKYEMIRQFMVGKPVLEMTKESLAKSGTPIGPYTRVLSSTELSLRTAETGHSISFKKDFGIDPGDIIIYPSNLRLVMAKSQTGGITTLQTKTASPMIAFSAITSSVTFKLSETSQSPSDTSSKTNTNTNTKKDGWTW